MNLCIKYSSKSCISFINNTFHYFIHIPLWFTHPPELYALYNYSYLKQNVFLKWQSFLKLISPQTKHGPWMTIFQNNILTWSILLYRCCCSRNFIPQKSWYDLFSSALDLCDYQLFQSQLINLAWKFAIINSLRQTVCYVHQRIITLQYFKVIS